MDKPHIVFIISFVLMGSAAHAGFFFARGQRSLQEEARGDFSLVLGVTLTLLALIIGFSFSMAIGRYDQRKNYEEAEANAIGTELVRTELLPPADAARVRALLIDYLGQRILFYTVDDAQRLRQINARTTQLQGELWAAVRAPAMAQPTPISATAVVGMNDVLNSQGYTQAAWWNRIPRSAWGLMGVIALLANLLVGYGARKAKGEAFLLLVLPTVLSIAFFLIADIDSPRGGIILVKPQNLESLSERLQPQ